MTGIKHDQDKPQFRLIPPKAELAFAKVLTMGAKKYAPDNWKQIEPHRYVDALMRHLNAFRQGEATDPESGEHHMAHIMCCAAFILEHDAAPIWQPAVGETYWSISIYDEPVVAAWENDQIDHSRFKRGHVFKTKKEAKVACRGKRHPMQVFSDNIY